MHSYICENCTHINKIANPTESGLFVNPVNGWGMYLSNDKVDKLIASTFKDLKGETEDGKKYTTLFLSVQTRHFLVEFMRTPTTISEEALKIFRTRIASVIDKVFDNFNVLGSLVLPSWCKLAITDLNQPFATFCFITVEETPDLQSKLDSIGLPYLSREGSVSTIPEL